MIMSLTIPLTISEMSALLQKHPRAFVVTGVLGLSVTWMVENYKKYLSLGEGGLPHNPFGWVMSTASKPFGRETLSVAAYEGDTKESWLDTSKILERRGSRPVTGWHFLPHRQLDRVPNPEIATRLDALFLKIAEANSALVELAVSPHERHVKGMLVHSSITPHPVAEQAWREICHVHPIDHSLHAVLSPADCIFIIERGWGERHPLSGISRHVPLPKEYLMIYAPRDEEELAVLELIIKASIGYMSSSRDVQ